MIFSNCAFAQSTIEANPVERSGFSIGLGVGAGGLRLKTNDTINNSFSTTLPNIKVGYMVNTRLELLVMLPGANYKYQGKARGFEGVILAGQYWIKDNWWVLGGVGLTFDAPAFYTVKDPKTAGFYTGFPAISVGTGYEIWHKRRFSLDVQYRFFLGTADLLAHEQRKGMSNMLILGFNWY